MWGNVTIRKFSINTKEKLFGAKICDLYTLPEPACLHSVTAWYHFKWCHAIIHPEKHLPLYCCHWQIIAASRLVAAHVHSFGIRQLTGSDYQKNKKKITRKHKGFGHCITFPVACSFCCLHWRKVEESQGSQTQPVCHKLCCGVKWVLRETNFSYLYLPQYYVLQGRSKTGGKITGGETQITLKFYMILAICKKK